MTREEHRILHEANVRLHAKRVIAAWRERRPVDLARELDALAVALDMAERERTEASPS